MPDQQADVEAFFQTHSIPQAQSMLDQILERQRIYAALRERAEKDLAQFGFRPSSHASPAPIPVLTR